jgi:outer membrane protein TolC
MKKEDFTVEAKKTAILLAAALLLTGGGITALAAGETQADTGAQTETSGYVAEAAPESAEAESAPAEEIYVVETESAAASETAEPETADSPAKTSSDPDGTVSFANLESRVRSGNLNYLILEESIAQIDATDYDKLKDDLKKALNNLADAQWSMISAGSSINTGNAGLDSALQMVAGLSSSSASTTLSAQYSTLREQFDDLKDGKIQADAADAVRQLRNTQDSLVMVAQGLYAQIIELDAADVTLARSLKALDRQITELEKRYELGQISALTLQQAKAGRDSLVSSRQTLSSSRSTAVMNLKALMGEDLDGNLTLSALPTVSASQLSSMDLDTDLAAAKSVSYSLYAAKKTLDDAESDFKDAGKDYLYNEKKYQYVQAQHAWQAAQYTYQAAEQSFELSFRTLYTQVQDDRQVLAAAKTALAVEQSNYQVDQLKYEQGTISHNDLLTAQDDLTTAEETVSSAQRDLFSAWLNYRWAVDYGIIN